MLAIFLRNFLKILEIFLNILLCPRDYQQRREAEIRQKRSFSKYIGGYWKQRRRPEIISGHANTQLRRTVRGE